MTNISNKARAIFLEAIERVGTDRSAFLNNACGGNAEMRDRVDRLLKSHDQLGSFHDEDANGDVTRDQPITEKPGAQIGPYKLLERIGEGGMGTVYMAEQKHPVKRRVAVKIIKPGMDTRQVIARFEAERQALAMMDHPNIAKVLDAGATEQGRPYFVMELINGLPVTKYCDDQHLTPKERLELFLPICQAIQHAHQKGIIHRDLKPGNILVALYDGRPVPKVIDFGVAKATNQTLTEKTMFTALGQIVGTLEYMSPEQAQRNQLDIDTRSDIYSLGAVLYELLTGEIPFNRQRLRSAGFDEMLRIIREEEPSKPSTKVSSSQSLPSIAANRRTEPARLGNLIRGELDWIIMKALDKDRDRRYETANGLGKDIERYLADEPVTASPPSRAYRLNKLVQRNKAAFFTAAAVLVALLLGVIGISWGLMSVSEANKKLANTNQELSATNDELATTNQQLDVALADAEKQRIRAESNEAIAEDEARRAERELSRTTQVKRLISEMLRGVTPEEARGADITLLKGILDDAADRLAAGEIEDELVAAELHRVVGESYSSIILFPEAEQHLRLAHTLYRRLLGDDAYPARLAEWTLGLHYLDSTQPAKAEAIFESSLAWWRSTFGNDHPQSLSAMTNLAIAYTGQKKYEQAAELLEKTLPLKKKVLGLRNRDTLVCMNSLGSAYWSLQRYADAEPLFEAAYQGRKEVLGHDHPRTLATNINRANTYRKLGRSREAERLYTWIFPVARQVLGEEHPHLLSGLSNYADMLTELGRFKEAEQLQLELLEVRRRIFAPDSSHVLTSIRGLARVYFDQRRLDKAEPLFDELLKLQRQRFGNDHANVISTMGELANVYRGQQRYQEAESMLQDVLEWRRRELGEQDLAVARTINHLALVYDAMGQKRKADSLYQQALDIQIPALGKENPQVLDTLSNWASLQKDLGDYDAAVANLLKIIEIRRRIQSPKHKFTLAAITNLGNTYLKMGQFEDAAKQFETSLPLKRDTLGPTHPWTGIAANGLAEAYLELGRREDALPLVRDMLEQQLATVRRPDAQPAQLNNVAWTLLRNKFEELRDPKHALELAKRACFAEEQANGQQLGAYLDTRALAEHQTGAYSAAVKTQRRALTLMSGSEKVDAEQRLAQYVLALAQSKEDGAQTTESEADNSAASEPDVGEESGSHDVDAASRNGRESPAR